ncbi:alkene reductase [Polaromonas sp. CG_9.11]|uniref:alkene reductase n=1 Tax=Polaromonas sp. CG_9.11 TaxID=2787730 RepID=UPI0018C9B446|nr:alkene reductase [Polaromonas sp. CG_9.11]MBG6075645.1 N-ethylmaleimide reductase [Polaromonas sp. CG_9.11]
MLKKLLTPLKMGNTTLPNRVIMAPLTRSRAGQPGDIPNALNVAYYTQRASAGMIVTEATQVSRQGQGYALTPGIYTDAQEAGWKKVVQAVHAQYGHIALQLWHVGRISHSLLQENGAAPVAPSALIAKNSQCFVIQPDGTAANVPTEMPRALDTEELPGIVAQYRQAAVRGRRAGFDFLELHAANGYLLNQFLATNSNQRTDAYGGSLENRARLTLEALDAVIEEIGAKQVGVRLSPHFIGMDMADSEAEASALYLAKAFSERGIAYLHIAEPDWAGGPELTPVFRAQIRAAFNGVLIFCGGYTAEEADALMVQGTADAVAFGRPFIANADLVERFRLGAALNTPDRSTFYGGGAHGYTDYPTLDLQPA